MYSKNSKRSTIQCVIHGSFGKYFAEIRRVHSLFVQATHPWLPLARLPLGLVLDDELNQDPRLIELLYLHKVKQLGPHGFSYFVNPEGYIGKSASYELGIAQVTNTRCFFSHPLNDHPAYLHDNAIWSAENLVDYLQTTGEPPAPLVRQNEQEIHRLWLQLMVPGSVVATGAIIEYEPSRKRSGPKEILLVKTHKWGNRYSVVGGKVRRNELLRDALLREVREETGLDGRVGQHICTFDQIKNSGYYEAGMQHIFVDNIVKVAKKNVRLNEEAQAYLWTTPQEALEHLDIEPNARTTLELYAT